MKYAVVYVGELVVEPERGDEAIDRDHLVESAFDAIMTELVRLGVEDPAVTGSITAGEIVMEMTVDADSLPDASERGAAAVRTAMHAAGVDTAGWQVEWHHAEAAFAEVTVA